MGHYTCERNNFSLTCPMVTKLGMYVAARENLIEDCNEELFEWWRKHLNQLPNRFKLTFRHKVRQFQLTPSAANPMKGGSMVGDTGGPHC